MMQGSTITVTEEYLVVKRYSSIQRVQHWGNVILMILLGVTGIEISQGKFPLGGMLFTQQLHLWAGLLVFILSWILYTFIIAVEGRVREILPTPRDVLDLFIILGCGIGLISDEHYPHYDFYDKDKGKHINKYHPTQKFLAVLNYIMLFMIAMSGFALYGKVAPGNWTFFVSIGDAIMNPLLDLGLPLRFFHFLVFAYFLVSTSIHFYFTVLPQNRQRLWGMLTGRQKIKFDEGTEVIVPQIPDLKTRE
ncbi:MAG: cytochrome b/b6 domain-containing protein [Candidatus Kariarchaeaceae archaeon]|jgi:cytochrome b subunit of formate dehydrogenase